MPIRGWTLHYGDNGVNGHSLCHVVRVDWQGGRKRDGAMLTAPVDNRAAVRSHSFRGVCRSVNRQFAILMKLSVTRFE